MSIKSKLFKTFAKRAPRLRGFTKHFYFAHPFLDAPDFGRMTPLHWAALRGRLDIIQTLVEQGADIDAKDIVVQTPLSLAVSMNDPKAVEK